MNKQSLFLTLLIILAIFLSSCSGLPAGLPDSPNNIPQAPKQEISVDYKTEQNQINPKEAWETFKKEYGLPGEMKAGGAGILWNEDQGIPKYIVGFKSRKYSGSSQNVANSFLQEHGNLIKLQNNSLYFIDTYKFNKEDKIIYEQRYKNIPVYGTSVQALITLDEQVRQLSADYYPDIKVIESAPSVDSSEFKKTVSNFLIKAGFPAGAELNSFVASRKPEKFIYPVGKGSNIKFYSTVLYRLPEARLFLDANTAEIINTEPTRIFN